VDPTAPYGSPGAVYHHQVANTDTVAEVHVPDITLDGDRGVLAATGRGLYFVDATTKNAIQISEDIHCNKLLRGSDGTLYIAARNPLPGSPFVTTILEDRQGRIWCTSFEGMFFYDRQKQFVRVFKKEDGLPSSRTVNAASAVHTPQGFVIVSNAEGITAFDPLSLQLSSVAPRPMFTQLRINNKVANSADEAEEGPHESINTLSELTLNHKQNILTIEVSAMDFTAPEKSEYKYKLQGFDQDWVHTDWKNRTATYTNLKPDHYTFVVLARRLL
jgi:hypothetical protein